MIKAPLYKVKDSLSEYVEKASDDRVLITKHGRPAAILIGFSDEEDWFDYCLEHDDKFVRRMEQSRQQAQSGQWKTLDAIESELESDVK